MITISYSKKDVKVLTKEWRKKLKESGFIDHEDDKGNLKQKNSRTIGWENQDRIRDFYLKLDSYLTNTPEIKENDRKILELWAEGKYFTSISKTIKRPVLYVKLICYKYKNIILEILDEE